MAFIPFLAPLFAGAGGAAAAGAGAVGAAAGATSALSTIGTVASIAGTGISALGSIQAGKQANAAAKAESQQLEMKAAEDRAVAQRDALEQRRQGALLQSNQIAAAAAGGGSTEDPGIMELLLDSGDVTEQNARLATYQGEVGARNDLFAASQRRIAGKQAQTGSYLTAAGQVFSGIGSLSGTKSYAQKYG